MVSLAMHLNHQMDTLKKQQHASTQTQMDQDLLLVEIASVSASATQQLDMADDCSTPTYILNYFPNKLKKHPYLFTLHINNSYLYFSKSNLILINYLWGFGVLG